MGRPKAQPFTLGKVTTKPHPTMPGRWQARGYFRDDANRLTSVTASGKSEASARRALQAKVKDAATHWAGGDASLNHNTTVRDAARLWLEHAARTPSKRGKRRALSTMAQYRANVDRYITCTCEPGRRSHGERKYPLASLTLAQVNDVGRVETWLAQVADAHGKGAATSARKMLSGILNFAARRGAIPASVIRTHEISTPDAKAGATGDRHCTDSECDYDCGRRHLDTDRAFTLEEVSRVLVAAEAMGPDMSDLVAFLYLTGARISEALHSVRWDGVDFEAGTIFIDGTKTKAAKRTVPMPDDLAERLKLRAARHGTDGLVFGVTRYPTKLGQPRNTNNVLKTLRAVLARAGVPWAGSHTFRRTLATSMDSAGDPLTVISAQLGHASTAVTHTYLKRQGTLSANVRNMTLPTTRAPLKAVG